MEIEAQVLDGTHLELARPIDLPPGSKVLISISTPQADQEHHQWWAFSCQSLQAAYGDDEPEYSLDRLKVPNPEFQP